ncbi:MAG: hypothetical protein H6739_30710 [Alphaproteobacteria bacterium]|nr:hypothetical protein [Alphaproteobacteria bacterium]
MLALLFLACAPDPTPEDVSPVLPDAQATPVQPQESEFDFWWGRWSVENLGPSGALWVNIGDAEAHIQPILSGRATLEQWVGTVNGNSLNGFSVRSFNADAQRWDLKLNWPNGSPAPFSSMVGTFEDGLGQFFAENVSGQSYSRFTFSEAQADSCQWDSSYTTDGGGHWTTTWIMEFSRLDDPEAADGATFPIADPPESSRCTDESARQLDGLVGAWSGTVRSLRADGVWAEGTTEVAVSSMIDGCGLLHFADDTWADDLLSQSFGAIAHAGAWYRIGATSLDPTLRTARGLLDGDTLTLTEDDALRERWSGVGTDTLTWTLETSADGETWEEIVVRELQPR